MSANRLQVRRDRLRRHRRQVLEETVDETERVAHVVRRGLLEQVGRWSGGRDDEEEHASYRSSGGSVEDALEQDADRAVVEQSAVGDPVRPGGVRVRRHPGPGRNGLRLRRSPVEGDERRLEGAGERCGAASRESQGRGNPFALGQLGPGEREEATTVDVLDHGAEGVGEPADLPREQRRRDVQGRGGRPRRILVPHRRERTDRELRQVLLQRGEHALVAVQQRRRGLVRGVAEEVGQGAEVHPEIAEPAEIDAGGTRRRQQRGVDASGTGPGQDIDVDHQVEQVDQAGVQLEGLGGRRAERRTCRELAAGAPPLRRLRQQVDLAGDTAHPDREAHPARHRGGQPELLRQLGHLGRLDECHRALPGRTARAGRTGPRPQCPMRAGRRRIGDPNCRDRTRPLSLRQECLLGREWARCRGCPQVREQALAGRPRLT